MDAMISEDAEEEDAPEAWSAVVGTSMLVAPYVSHDSICAVSYSVDPVRLHSGVLLSDAKSFIRNEEDPPKDDDADGIVNASPCVASGVSLVTSAGEDAVWIVSSAFVFAATARILRAPMLFNASGVPVSVADMLFL